MRAAGRQPVSAARLAAGAALVALAGFLGVLGWRLASPPGVGPGAGAPGVNSTGYLVPTEPRPAQDFALRGFDGEPIRLSDLRGKVVVLNFWSSWCGPCVEEAPLLERVSRRYADRGVVVLGANVWTEDEEARNFLLEQGITYPNGRTEGALAAEYGLTGIPETFIIDADGTLVRRWNGPFETERELTALIEPLLPAARR